MVHEDPLLVCSHMKTDDKRIYGLYLRVHDKTKVLSKLIEILENFNVDVLGLNFPAKPNAKGLNLMFLAIDLTRSDVEIEDLLSRLKALEDVVNVSIERPSRYGVLFDLTLSYN